MPSSERCESLEMTLAALEASRRRSARDLGTSGRGIYVLYLMDCASLQGIHLEREALYVGMTEDGFDSRNHFGHKDSSFSSFRRSLGAILKQTLGLSARPRGLGKTRKDMTQYRFTNECEEKLTEWMLTHVEYSFARIEDNIGDLERNRSRIGILQMGFNL